MSYELKDYLNSINFTKENLMSEEDPTWEKKYPPFIVNKCLSGFCLLYTSPSPRDLSTSRMPSSA